MPRKSIDSYLRVATIISAGIDNDFVYKVSDCRQNHYPNMSCFEPAIVQRFLCSGTAPLLGAKIEMTIDLTNYVNNLTDLHIWHTKIFSNQGRQSDFCKKIFNFESLAYKIILVALSNRVFYVKKLVFLKIRHTKNASQPRLSECFMSKNLYFQEFGIHNIIERMACDCSWPKSMLNQLLTRRRPWRILNSYPLTDPKPYPGYLSMEPWNKP